MRIIANNCYIINEVCIDEFYLHDYYPVVIYKKSVRVVISDNHVFAGVVCDTYWSLYPDHLIFPLGAHIFGRLFEWN